MGPLRRLLVIGHDHVAGLGYIGDELKERGFALDQITVVPEERFAQPNVDFTYPDPRSWDGIVSTGAPWPREQTNRWWPREVEFLRTAFDSGVPILGICFGGQLLAEALGGAVKHLDGSRVGWSHIEPVSEGISTGPWFQWHSDQIVPPPTASVLAASADGCEAFADESALGVQFHPEMNLALLRKWLTVAGAGLGRERSCQLLAATAEVEQGDLRERVRELTTSALDVLF